MAGAAQMPIVVSDTMDLGPREALFGYPTPGVLRASTAGACVCPKAENILRSCSMTSKGHPCRVLVRIEITIVRPLSTEKTMTGAAHCTWKSLDIVTCIHTRVAEAVAHRRQSNEAARETCSSRSRTVLQRMR